MTETEQKALALLNEVFEGKTLNNTPFDYLPTAVSSLVLLRAIEQHEVFKQEVSDAAERAAEVIEQWAGDRDDAEFLDCLIIPKPKPKPDPLEEVLMEIDHAAMWVDKCAEEIRASLKARGWEIREKGQ